MDTVTEVPSFKLAKVGKGRERKRGGASWLGVRSAGSGFSGAAGGSGAGAGFVGLMSAKTLMILTVAVVSSMGAWTVGQLGSNSESRSKPKAVEKKLFSDKGAQQYGDLSNVIKTENTIPNSMGYVNGSLDGMTPEERAKKAAEAEAARVAEEAAAKKAADEEAKKEAASPASSAPMDPATIASTLAGKKKAGLTAGKFGKLGSSFGGGGSTLSGGAGLSGGINRNFGGATELASSKMTPGGMSAFRNAAKPGYSSAGRMLAGKSKSKGFAKRQLDNAFGLSRQAMAAGKSENAAASAASPFDNNPGQGNVIAGPGVNNGAGAGTADGGTPANTPQNMGGPLNTSGAACSAGMAPDINGNCQPIQTPHHKKDANYQSLIDTAKALMALVAVLAAIALIWEYTSWLDFGLGEFVAHYLKVMIVLIGLTIVGLGAAIASKSGDMVMGGIVGAVGAFIAGSAMLNAGSLVGTQETTSVAAGALISSALGFLMTSMTKPANMD